MEIAPAVGAAGSAAALRHVMGHFASGVTVVSTVTDGVPHAMTATAVCSVSLEPPLVLVCVGKASRLHPLILATGAWTLCILSDTQGRDARHFARKGRDLQAQFEDVAYRSAPFSGAPVLAGSLAWLDLRSYATHDAGDHTIVVGEVVAASDESVTGAPLTYYAGAFSDASHPSQDDL